jgi:hypothetical protein
MRRLLVTTATSIALLIPAAPAAAKITEIGKTATDAPPPSCPSTPCLAVSRTTGFQVKVGADRGIFVAPRSGKLVAWTITLSKPGKKQTTFFNSKLGGPASAGIAVLKPQPKLHWVVSGLSPIIQLEPYFGMTAQFPLDTALTVKKGYAIALNVPTWAPALAVGLDNTNIWRASRPKGKCDDTQTQTAQLQRAANAEYRCLYRGVRLTYTATLISTP